jgi:hypothetical protein
MRRLIFEITVWAFLVLLGEAALSQQSVHINVSAIVPPRLCQYPNPCKATDPVFGTKATIENGVVHYLGARPKVTQIDDLLIVLF